VKKLISLSLILVIGYFLLNDKTIQAQVNNIIYSSPCDTPILYKIDSVDPRFGLSVEDFRKDTSQAAQIWNRAKGKTLFKEDSQNQTKDLSVNLVYDQRQALNTQINQLENQLQNGKNSLGPQIEQYKKLSADFKQNLANLNAQIDYWNKQGGAPPDQYDKLKQQQADLQKQADSLNAMARSLNLSADQYNGQVNKLDQTVQNFNQELVQKPEEGIFDGGQNRIEVYFNVNQTELVHTLAHELGHARTLPHNNNSLSIMYPNTNTRIVPSNDDIAALDAACQKLPVWETAPQKIYQLIREYKHQ